jgi:hypothetical protein
MSELPGQSGLALPLPHGRVVPFADIGPGTPSGYVLNSRGDALVRASSMTLVFERAREKLHRECRQRVRRR